MTVNKIFIFMHLTKVSLLERRIDKFNPGLVKIFPQAVTLSIMRRKVSGSTLQVNRGNIPRKLCFQALVTMAAEMAVT